MGEFVHLALHVAAWGFADTSFLSVSEWKSQYIDKTVISQVHVLGSVCYVHEGYR